jgi:hypothetical protein
VNTLSAVDAVESMRPVQLVDVVGGEGISAEVIEVRWAVGVGRNISLGEQLDQLSHHRIGTAATAC